MWNLLFNCYEITKKDGTTNLGTEIFYLIQFHSWNILVINMTLHCKYFNEYCNLVCYIIKQVGDALHVNIPSFFGHSTCSSWTFSWKLFQKYLL